MSKLDRYDASDDVALIGDSLLDNGAVIVENLLSEAITRQVKADIEDYRAAADPTIEHLNPVISAFFGPNTRHVNGMAAKSDTFANEVMCNRVYMALCDRILLPHCADYQLNLGHLMDRGPGAQAQWMHRDEDVWKHFEHDGMEIQVASMIALEDFRKENGCTYVIPGSHKWDKSREGQEDEKAHAEMSAGSAVIYLGSTIHGGGTNSTRDEWRPGLHISYTLGWLRTEENNVLAVPPARAAKLSKRAQQLLGYCVHDAIEIGGGYLGMVDMQDPASLLASNSRGQTP